MNRTRLDDIADRARTSRVHDWAFALLLLAMLAFMVVGLRTTVLDAGGREAPVQWVGPDKPARSLEAAVTPGLRPPG